MNAALVNRLTDIRRQWVLRDVTYGEALCAVHDAFTAAGRAASDADVAFVLDTNQDLGQRYGAPYVVVRRTDGRRVANHYRHEAATVAHNGAGLAHLADSYETGGVATTVVARHSTMTAAVEEANRRQSANSLPGITYHAQEER